MEASISLLLGLLAFCMLSMDLVLSIVYRRLSHHGRATALIVFAATSLALVFFQILDSWSALSFTQGVYRVLGHVWTGLVIADGAFLISFVPYFPLASGLLTGKYDHLVEFPADDIRSQIADFKEPRFSQILAAVAQVRPIAAAHNATVTQVVLAWYLQNPLISAVIPGAKRAQQVEANAQAMNVALSDAEYQTITAAFKSFQATRAGKSLKDPD